MHHPSRFRFLRAPGHPIVGWVLFVVCALFFMAAGWRNGDVLTFIGSILFLAACLVFLLPLLGPENDHADEDG